MSLPSLTTRTDPAREPIATNVTLAQAFWALLWVVDYLAVAAAVVVGLYATHLLEVRSVPAGVIAVALLTHPRVEVIMLGGRIFKHSAVTCGAAAAEAAAGVSADLFLLGVTGVHPVHGLTTGDADEAAMKRALAARAAETYVLASAEKLGAVSRYRVLPLPDVTGVVTDGSGGDMVDQLVAQGTTVHPG